MIYSTLHKENKDQSVFECDCKNGEDPLNSHKRKIKKIRILWYKKYEKTVQKKDLLAKFELILQCGL